ncbi:MAG: hypothetical protein IRY99_26245 [Isosphaeraceae bacterium]|nr:hypothetical protein [Isosphaeraceae bacterium]
MRWGAFAVALVLCGSFLHLVKTDFTAAPQRTLGLRRLISRGQVDAAAKALQKAFPPDSTFPEAPVGQLLGNPNYGEVEVVTAERHWYTPISRLYRVRRDKAVIWYPGGKVQEASRHLELRPKAEAAKA